MSVVAFDFETTGLPDFKARSVDPRQPHIVQMALLTYGDDGTELSQRVDIVKPDGWAIPPEMTAIHGISHEQAMEEGIPEGEAIGRYLLTMLLNDLRVAHNEQFDRRIARIALTRGGYPREMIELLEARPAFCTCEASRSHVKAPPTPRMLAAGFTGYKTPNLSETYLHFFREEIAGAHDALVDARAAGRVYFHLRSLETAQ